MDVSTVRIPVSCISEGSPVQHWNNRPYSYEEDSWHAGRITMTGQLIYRHKRGEAKDEGAEAGTGKTLQAGVHADLFRDDKLVIVEGGRITVITKDMPQVPCTTARASKFGIIVEDGKTVSLVTEIKDFPRATPLGDGLVVAPIFGYDRKINRLFDTPLGELLNVTSGGLASTYLLNDMVCKAISENNHISYVKDDIALYCTARGVFAIDLYKPDKEHFIFEIAPWKYIPSPVGITYITCVTPTYPTPIPGSKEYQLVTITRKAPELCVVCAVAGPLVRAVADCGHIIRAHARCVEALTKCNICDKPTDRAIIVRD